MIESVGRIEAVLAQSRAGQASPYRWLARAISASATLVLDIACGAGAVSREVHRPDRVVVGLDKSDDELAVASSRGPGPWVQADALRLPFASDSFDAVTSSMGLAVIRPTLELLNEVSRVLRPGGAFIGLLPAVFPASPADVLVAAQLSWQLKTVLRFPGDLTLSFAALCRGAGLTKMEDARERYAYTIRSREDAQRLIAALDLTGVSDERVAGAIDFLAERALDDGPIEVAIPLRRVVAIK